MPSAPAPPSVGQTLERQRLEHRIRRVEQGLAALEHRATLRTRQGAPPPLTHAVREFSAELSRLNGRLAELRRHRP